MTEVNAISALQSSKNATDDPHTIALAVSTTTFTPGAETTEGPAVINDVAALRTRFTPAEVASIQATLLPSTAGLSHAQVADRVDTASAQIAAIREQGESAFIIASSINGGSKRALIMSASELKAAISSGDSASWGSTVGADGQKRSVKDLVGSLTGLAPAATPAAPAARPPVLQLTNTRGDTTSVVVFQASASSAPVPANYGPHGS